MKKTVRVFFAVVLFVLLVSFAAFAAACGNDGDSNGDHEHTYGTEWSHDSDKHWHGAACGHIGAIADQAEHSYTERTVEPTCTEKGYVEHTCVCGYSYRDSEVAALGHDLTETSRVASDCTVNGWAEYECSRCDYEAKRELALDSAAHSYDTEHYVYSTAEHWYAASCAHSSEKTSVTEHKFTDDVQAPTCTEKGYTVHTCVCGYSYRDSEVAALGHEPVEISRKASTCSKYGYVESKCDRCGENLIQSLELDPTAHAYSTEWAWDGEKHWHPASCIHSTEKADERAHSLTSRTVAPTCSERGYTSMSCDCGYEEIDENSYTDTVNHTFASGDNWSQSAAYHYHAATCGTDSAHKNLASDKTGHTFDRNNVCTVCNYSLAYTQGLSYGYSSAGVKISGIESSASELVIPAYVEYEGQTRAVTELGLSAFNNNKNITSVIIPGTVTTISNQVFGNCPKLRYIYIPSSVNSISSAQVFEGSSNLTTVEIDENNATYKMDGNCLIKKGTNELVAVFGKYTVPDYVTVLGKRVFAGADFTEFTMPNSIITVGNDAFNSCKSLQSVVFNNVKVINGTAFAGCSALTSIDLTNVETVGTGAFQGCTSLASINFGSKLKTLNAYAFNGCTARETINVASGNSAFKASGNCLLKSGIVVLGGIRSEIPANATGIGERAFWYASPAQVTLTSGIKTIASYAFAQSQLTSISVPGTVSEIGASAFYKCESLSSVELNEGIKTVKSSAFKDCVELHTVTIPASMTTIESDSFSIGAKEAERGGGLTSAVFVDKTGWKCGNNEVDFDDPSFDVCYALKYSKWTHTAA